MGDNYETLHGRQVRKNPQLLDAEGIFDLLRTSKPKWRVIASVLPTEQDASIDGAMFLAAIDEGILSPIDSRKALAVWASCACKLPSRIKPKADYAHGHPAGLSHVCNARQCAGSAEGVRELAGVLQRSFLLSRFHLFAYNDDDLRLAQIWLVWEAWDRLFEATNETAATWTRALPGVVAELRSIAMRNAIHAATSTGVVSNPPRRRCDAMGGRPQI